LSHSDEGISALRQFLTALESRSMTIEENGEDVTQRELDNLSAEIEHLESAFSPRASIDTTPRVTAGPGPRRAEALRKRRDK
jgi:hypothetical protein